MPNLDLRTKRLRYAASDERLLSSALGLCELIAQHDCGAQQDSGTGAVALKHLLEHVRQQRSGKLPGEAK